MGTRTRWLAYVMLGGLFLTPASVRAQNVGHGEPTNMWEYPLPLMLDNKESGFYTAFEALYMQLNNPLRKQNIAFRGFIDNAGNLRGQGEQVTLYQVDGTTVTIIPRAQGDDVLGNFFRLPGPAGARYGSQATAFGAQDLDENQFEPGYRLTGGYRFRNGVSVEATYFSMSQFRNAVDAGIIPPSQNVFNSFNNSFLTIPFFNFSSYFSGPQRDVVSNVLPVPIGTAPGNDIPLGAAEVNELRQFRGLPLAAYGIWNAADDISIMYNQDIWGLELNFKLPINVSDAVRCYALVGPRYLWVQEDFRILTYDATLEGDVTIDNTATYQNKVNNYLYGGQAGLGSEVYIHSGWAMSFEVRGGVFADVFHAKVKYVRGDEAVSVQADHHDTTVAPMFQAGAYLWWYPFDGVQIRGGYEFLGIFNVIRSEQPVDFDLGRNDPDYDRNFLYLQGLNVGVAFIF